MIPAAPKMPSHWGPDWRWYALRVEPQRELAIEARLREFDHFTFVPIKHTWTKPRRGEKRKALSARAQYPGYVFIGFPPGFAAPWTEVFEFPGILGAIGRDGEPMAIHEPTMTAMLAGTRRPINYINKHGSKKRRDKTQRTAEIISGPYQDRSVRVVQEIDDDPELYQLFNAAA